MDLKKITRGNIWNEDMDFETFCDCNNFPTYSQDVQELYNEISMDYYFEKYEND